MLAASRCLVGKALEWYEQECTDGMHPHNTLEEFITGLRQHYHHVGRVDKARNELHALTFSGDLVNYVSTFRTLHLILRSHITAFIAAEVFFGPLLLDM